MTLMSAQGRCPHCGRGDDFDHLIRPPVAASRSEWHDKAWALFHAKTFDDTMLLKVNIHTIRAVFDATYDALHGTRG